MTTIDTTYNGAIPSFPQVLNADIEYTGIKVLVDLSSMASLGKMEGVQTIYVDLINHNFDVHIVMPDSQQRITAKANTQGYYPVLATSLMKFEITSEGDGNFPIKFINFPIALGVWGFNVIKGDQGEQGESGGIIQTINSDALEGVEIAQVQPELIILKKLIAGDNIAIEDTGTALIINSTATGGGGSNVVIVNADYPPFGLDISYATNDPEGNGEQIVLKQLVAGDNISIDNEGDALIINSTSSGGGGGGGDQAPSYISLSFDVTDLPVYGEDIVITDPSIYLVGNDIRYQDGSIYLDDGLYDIEIKSDLTISTGENAIAVYLEDEDYYAAISAPAKVDNFSGGWFNTILRHKMRVNLGGNSELIFKVGNLTNIVDNATIQIIINKISDIAIISVE